MERLEVSQTSHDLPLDTELDLDLVANSFFDDYGVVLELCKITYKLWRKGSDPTVYHFHIQMADIGTQCHARIDIARYTYQLDPARCQVCLQPLMPSSSTEHYYHPHLQDKLRCRWPLTSWRWALIRKHVQQQWITCKQLSSEVFNSYMYCVHPGDTTPVPCHTCRPWNSTIAKVPLMHAY